VGLSSDKGFMPRRISCAGGSTGDIGEQGADEAGDTSGADGHTSARSHRQHGNWTQAQAPWDDERAGTTQATPGSRRDMLRTVPLMDRMGGPSALSQDNETVRQHSRIERVDPFIGLQFLDGRPHAIDARVGKGDVQPPKALHTCRDSLLHVGSNAPITVDVEGLPPLLLHSPPAGALRPQLARRPGPCAPPPGQSAAPLPLAAPVMTAACESNMSLPVLS